MPQSTPNAPDSCSNKLLSSLSTINARIESSNKEGEDASKTANDGIPTINHSAARILIVALRVISIPAVEDRSNILSHGGSTLHAWFSYNLLSSVIVLKRLS